MRREKWLTVSRSSLEDLKRGNYEAVDWHISPVPDQVNNFDMWNMELVVMPYFNNGHGEGILLRNTYREARFFRTPMLIPDFLYPIGGEDDLIKTVFSNNATLNLCEMVKSIYDRDTVMRSFHEQELNPDRVLHKDLSINYSKKYVLTIYDEKYAFDVSRTKGCTVTIVECPIVDELSDHELWVPVPKDAFLEYYNSKFPDTYISRFTPYARYDESSNDSRMKRSDAKLIADVFAQIDSIKESEP